jgi:hypothetical protein
MVTGFVSSIDRGDTMAVVTELGAGVDGQVTIRPGW